MNELLLSNYDFYDVHAVLVAIRYRPENRCNPGIVQALVAVLSAPQDGNVIEDNLVRKRIRKVDGLDEELFRFAFADNVYTFGTRIVKEEYPYSFLRIAFEELLKCVVSGDFDQVCSLADALHNVPILLADGCKRFKKALKLQFSAYNRLYGSDLQDGLLRVYAKGR